MSTASNALTASSMLGSAYSQSQAASSQAAYQQSQADANARLADIQAVDAIKRGDQTVAEVRKNGAKVSGSQRAALAAQGIDVNDGSAADLISQTQAAIDQDSRTATTNAWREAWGYKVQANNSRTQGQLAGISGNALSQSTLLTGGMRAVGASFEKKG